MDRYYSNTILDRGRNIEILTYAPILDDHDLYMYLRLYFDILCWICGKKRK